MRTAWNFTQNPFDNSTKGNYAKFRTISLFHLNALQSKAGDAFFDVLIAFYLTLHNAYMSVYTPWLASQGTHVGGTASFEDELNTLSSEDIEEWDLQIQNVYRKGTPEYKALLPKGRTPFQRGKRDDRVTAVAALETAIGTDVDLAAVKVLVHDKYEALRKAREKQQGEFTTTDDFSSDVEQVRVIAAKGMYKDLGDLMSHYSDNPEDITAFFDLENIRSAEQREFTGTVKKLDYKNIAKRTLPGNTVIKIANNGDRAFKLYSAPEKNDPVGATFVEVAAHEEEEIPYSSLGTGPYIKIYNPDPDFDGAFDLKIE